MQTSPEAPVQKNAAAGGSTQTLVRQGPSTAEAAAEPAWGRRDREREMRKKKR